ncbi:flotillin-2a-like [Watersipora subatra]|uniref:flotillin-2a-like n=1 Tax=Watersipora subatra TaxID=2589382 RepID=UPI00355B1DE1
MGQVNVTGPNQALVVSGGCCTNEKATIIGGWIWSWWFCSDVSAITLETMTMRPTCESVETTEGVPLNVTGVAQCKVMTEPELLKIACEQFLGKTTDQIKSTLLNTLEGHLRCILGSLTVEQVYRDRDEFAKLIRDVASPDLGRMGIEILSFTVKDVADNVQYLSSLGRAQTAVVIRNANIAIAEAERDATIRESECKKQTENEKYKADSHVADAKREFQTKSAAFDMEVNAAKAEAELAYALQTAKTKQEVTLEEVNIDIVERRKLVDVEDKEILRKEKELVGTIRKPAEAEGYRLEKLAEGKRFEKIAAASGDAEGIKLVGVADASKIGHVGSADAEALRLKAEAYKRYGNAAITAMIVEKLPLIAAEVSQPLKKIDEIVMIGEDKISMEVAKILSNLPPSVEALTGKDITEASTALW